MRFAALTRKQQLLLDARQLDGNLPAWEYHVHTSFTDGAMTVHEAVSRALTLGLTRLVFTEHTESWRVKSPDWFSEFVSTVQMERERARDQIEILIGLEAPATDFATGLEITKDMEDTAEFILGAAHRYPELKGRVRDLSLKQAIEFEFRTLMALAQNPRVDALAHIGGTCQNYCGPFPLELAEEIILTAAANGIAIELNSRYHNPIAPFLALCRKHGAWIIPGSDAHRPEEIGEAIQVLQKVR